MEPEHYSIIVPRNVARNMERSEDGYVNFKWEDINLNVSTYYMDDLILWPYTVISVSVTSVMSLDEARRVLALESNEH
jgi:hypothetical protein